MVWIEELFIVVITLSQAQEMEAKRANQKGEPSIKSLKKDKELAQWGNLDAVTWWIGKAITLEMLRKTTPNPDVLLGIDLPEAKNVVSWPTTLAMDDAPRSSKGHCQPQVREDCSELVKKIEALIFQSKMEIIVAKLLQLAPYYAFATNLAPRSPKGGQHQHIMTKCRQRTN